MFMYILSNSSETRESNKNKADDSEYLREDDSLEPVNKKVYPLTDIDRKVVKGCFLTTRA